MAILDTLLLTNQADGSCSLPFHDGPRRIWALWWGGSRPNPQVCYSDDFGETWTVWADIPTDSEAPLLTYGGLFRDTQGNIYYNTREGDVHPGARGIGRIDATTKQISKCFNFYVTSALAEPTAWDTMAYAWNFTLDLDGNIYIGQYALSYWDGSAWVAGGMTNYDSHYVWKGDPSGTSWQRIDTFVTAEPDCRHIHAMHTNPYDGTIWICIGDIPKVNYFSTDGLATVTKATAPADNLGHTGLTFTTERAYFADDLTGTTQRVWRTPAADRSPLEVAYSPPTKWQVPWYYLRAYGDDEMWGTVVNDGQYTWGRSSLVRMRKTKGTIGPWTVEGIFEAEGGSHAWTIPYDIAHNGFGVAPADYPYVMFRVVKWGVEGPYGIAPGVHRTQRVSDADLATYEAAYPVTAPTLTATPTPTDITLQWAGTATRIERRVV